MTERKEGREESGRNGLTDNCSRRNKSATASHSRGNETDYVNILHVVQEIEAFASRDNGISSTKHPVHDRDYNLYFFVGEVVRQDRGVARLCGVGRGAAKLECQKHTLC